MSEKTKFYLLLGLVILSVIWLFVARHFGSDNLLTNL